MAETINTVATTTPEWEAAQTSTTAWLEALTVPVITNDVTYAVAFKALQDLKGERSDLDDKRKEITDPLTRGHKNAMKQYRDVDNPLAKRENEIRDALSDYTAAKERKAAEDQRELDRIAYKAAETERLAEAERLEKEGKPEEAEAAIEPAAIERAVQERRTIVPSAPPKAEGESRRKEYHFEVTDATKLPREFLKPDESVIRSRVNSLKGNVTIPGVRIWTKDAVSVRR